MGGGEERGNCSQDIIYKRKKKEGMSTPCRRSGKEYLSIQGLLASKMEK